MKFSVGQVVYLLTRKDPKVYPALVCEEIQKKSLSGKKTSYVVRLPTEDQQEIDLERLDAEIFMNVEEARKAMVEKATEQIDLILQKALEISHVFSEFALEIESGPASLDDGDSIEEQENTSYATVDLGDGQVARINTKDLNKIKGESNE